MTPAGFEPAVLAGERPHIHALDRAATGIVIGHVITHPKPAVLAGERPHIHAQNRAATGIVIVHVITHPKPNQLKPKDRGRRITSFHLAIPVLEGNVGLRHACIIITF